MKKGDGLARGGFTRSPTSPSARIAQAGHLSRKKSEQVVSIETQSPATARPKTRPHEIMKPENRRPAAGSRFTVIAERPRVKAAKMRTNDATARSDIARGPSEVPMVSPIPVLEPMIQHVDAIQRP